MQFDLQTTFHALLANGDPQEVADSVRAACRRVHRKNYPEVARLDDWLRMMGIEHIYKTKLPETVQELKEPAMAAVSRGAPLRRLVTCLTKLFVKRAFPLRSFSIAFRSRGRSSGPARRCI